MGTPEFAVPCLKRLIDMDLNVVGVYTQPDKPKGRGYQLAPTPVKEIALQHNLQGFQPNSLKNAGRWSGADLRVCFALCGLSNVGLRP